jgi:hypothetical protein
MLEQNVVFGRFTLNEDRNLGNYLIHRMNKWQVSLRKLPEAKQETIIKYRKKWL